MRDRPNEASTTASPSLIPIRRCSHQDQERPPPVPRPSHINSNRDYTIKQGPSLHQTHWFTQIQLAGGSPTTWSAQTRSPTISHDLPRHGPPRHDLPRSFTISHDMVGPSIDSSRPRSLFGLERGDNLLVGLDALRPHCLHQRGGRLGGCRHRCSQCSRSRRPQAPHKTQPWALARSLAARMKAINEMGISCAPLILQSLVERLPISDYRVLPAHTGSRVQLGRTEPTRSSSRCGMTTGAGPPMPGSLREERPHGGSCTIVAPSRAEFASLLLLLAHHVLHARARALRHCWCSDRDSARSADDARDRRPCANLGTVCSG